MKTAADDARRPAFGIAEQREPDGWVRLTLSGDLDLASAPSLHDKLSALTSTQTSVRLDLSGLEFVDSAGLRVLVNAVRDARDDGPQLVVCGAPGAQVQRLFEITGFDKALGGSVSG